MRAFRHATRVDVGPGDGPVDLPFICAADLAGKPVPARQWHVPDLVPAHTVTLLGGDSSTGKSILALQLAVATALGLPWIGRPVLRTGPALYLSAEDDLDELHARLSDICIGASVPMSSLGALTLIPLAGEDAVLAQVDPNTRTLAPTQRLFGIEDRMAELRPALLAVDTLADVNGGEENNRGHARQFIGMLRGIAIRLNCVVLLLAHPSVAGMQSGSGLSGSTAWNASVRSRLYLERILDGSYEQDPNKRRLVQKKSNYGPIGGEIGLKWQAGFFVADAPASGLDRVAAGGKAKRVFMQLLRQFAKEGRDVGFASGRSYAPAKFAQHPDAEGVTARAFAAAMDLLMRDGKVRVEETGPPSRRTRRLVEALADA